MGTRGARSGGGPRGRGVARPAGGGGDPPSKVRYTSPSLQADLVAPTVTKTSGRPATPMAATAPGVGRDDGQRR